MSPEKKDSIKSIGLTAYRVGVFIAFVGAGIFGKMNLNGQDDIKYELYKIQTQIEQKQVDVNRIENRVSKVESDVDNLKERVYTLRQGRNTNYSNQN